jgi:RNA polymerase subunit RPABC4/transcription elongation factor Spt4
MEFNKVLELMEQACRDCILEIECPVCGGTIVTEPDATDLYCEECKQIVMQNPLTEAGLI